jgi:hypothetical protein
LSWARDADGDNGGDKNFVGDKNEWDSNDADQHDEVKNNQIKEVDLRIFCGETDGLTSQAFGKCPAAFLKWNQREGKGSPG